MPEVGELAPDFTARTDGDGEIVLSELKGGTVVVYFYPKDDTPGCTREAIDFSSQIDAFTGAGARVIGVSPDTVKKHDRFKAKHELTVTLAADEDKRICQAYGVWVEKSMYGRRYMGVERSTFLIDGSGTIAKIWRKVKVKDHAEEVLAATRTLSA